MAPRKRLQGRGIPHPDPMPDRICVVRVSLTGCSPLNCRPEPFVTTVMTTAAGLLHGAAEREARRRAAVLGIAGPYTIDEVVQVSQSLGPPARPVRRGRGLAR